MILTNEIFEYDIEHAGPSVYYEKKIITKEQYERLISLPKEKRVIETGLLERDNPDRYNKKMAAYDEYINKFIKKNKIKPHHIIEVVHDAIWLAGIIPSELQFGEVKFRKKKYYNIQYIYERRNIRFYLNTGSGEFDIRGGHLNTDSRLYRPFKTLLQAFEFDSDDIYDKVHKIRRKLKKNEDAYGKELVRGLKNSTLINNLLKEVVK